MLTSRPIALIGALALIASVAAHDLVASRQAQVPPGRQQQPTVPAVSYDVDVTLVEVDAVVTDEQGRVIRDLRADEFQVLEDGTPQTIDRVSFVEIPIERGERRAADASPSAADVHTNLHRFDGRLYVLLLDDLHTATSRSGRVKAAARRFIQENLDPTDLAAVVHMSGASRAGQGFTSDRQLLLESVERFSGRKLRSETLNLIDTYNQQLQLTGRTPEPERIRDADEPARADDARIAFDSVARIARQVGPVRGRRKALIWFGEGLPYDMFEPSGLRQASLVAESARSAVAAAGQANLAIYGVDARGLAGVGDETMQLNAAPDPAANLDASRLARELARSQDNLRQIASDTGGFAVVNTDEFARAFERVVDDNSAYYLLGYYPKNAKAEGAYRSLEVRVTRPGASVRARRGYTLRRTPTAATSKSDLPGVPATLQEALASPVPRSGLPMEVHAAAFKGTSAKASVLVTIEYAASAFVGRAPGRRRRGSAPGVGAGARLQRQGAGERPFDGGSEGQGGHPACDDSARVSHACTPRTGARPLPAAGRRSHHRHRARGRCAYRDRGARFLGARSADERPRADVRRRGLYAHGACGRADAQRASGTAHDHARFQERRCAGGVCRHLRRRCRS